MKEFLGLKAKTCSCLMDDGGEYKKKTHKKVCNKIKT